MSKINAPIATELVETEFLRLLDIMNTLRENCPWDKKQTISSLRHLTIEEVYEMSEAIVNEDYKELKNELGDIMLHVVFYARMAQEKGFFDMKALLTGVCEKLIRRHPHVYGNVDAGNEEEVKKNWEAIKQSENKGTGKTILSGVPSGLPALVKAIRIQEKAKGAGFDWSEKNQVWEKVKEELKEFEREQNNTCNDADKIEGEFGDLLFSLVNYARFVGINPEDALERTNKKFIKRFTYLETQSAKDGKKLSEMTLTEMDEYWSAAKKLE